MESMAKHKQQRIAYETTYLYAPLAHRLGLYAIKSELEDLSLKYTEREIYKNIASKLQQSKRERTKYINDFIKPLQDKLEASSIKYRIFGRPKSIHSIYSKMKKQGVGFEEVYDLFAIRIIIDTIPEQEKSDCWKAYSIVTEEYLPNPARLRDWISTPKTNGYESLHTTVMGSKGRWVEVQIRTERMDEIAEKGFAAHWKYKDGNSHEGALDEWLRNIRELLKNPDSTTFDFLDDFQLNLFSKEIYVFTPKGDLKMLPQKSTALDFAYDIHTAIGHSCIGAKVNHKLVPLSYVLKNGDQIEILTSKKQKPTEDWLNIVVTAKARGRIKDSLKEDRRKIAEDGKILLEKKLKQLDINIESINMDELVLHFKEISQLDLYTKIALKKINLQQLDDIERMGGKFRFGKTPKPQASFDEAVRATLKKNAELIIFGENSNDIMYKMAPCCNPIPGDEVFGFITINEGIKIHKISCPNAKELMANYSYRIVKTKWTEQREVAFLAGLKITGYDDIGVVNEITNIISGQENINMRSISLESNDGIYEGNIKLYVQDTLQLEQMIAKLKEMKSISKVERYDA